jgi:putative transcriptional regulator
VWRPLAASSALPAIALLAIRFHPVQYSVNQELDAGKLLIASPKLADPNFAESVVLIVEYDADKGAMGLILNRRTKVPLSRVFPDTKGAGKDPIFEGGPVDKGSAQALLRSREKPESAARVLIEVWATGNKDRIEKSVGEAAATFRLYAGYSGWGSGQLEHEIELGGWSVLRASAALVFDDDPDSLWQRLQRQIETRIAGLGFGSLDFLTAKEWGPRRVGGARTDCRGAYRPSVAKAPCGFHQA